MKFVFNYSYTIRSTPELAEEHHLTPADVIVLLSASIFEDGGGDVCMPCVSGACGSTALLPYSNSSLNFTR